MVSDVGDYLSSVDYVEISVAALVELVVDDDSSVPSDYCACCIYLDF